MNEEEDIINEAILEYERSLNEKNIDSLDETNNESIDNINNIYNDNINNSKMEDNKNIITSNSLSNDSILKRNKNMKRKTVSWSKNLEEEKYFMRDDYPDEIGLTYEQVMNIQNRLYNEEVKNNNNINNDFDNNNNENNNNINNNKNSFTNFQSQFTNRNINIKTLNKINEEEKFIYLEDKENSLKLIKEKERIYDSMVKEIAYKLYELDQNFKQIRDDIGELSIKKYDEKERIKKLSRVIYKSNIPNDPKNAFYIIKKNKTKLINIPLIKLDIIANNINDTNCKNINLNKSAHSTNN